MAKRSQSIYILLALGFIILAGPIKTQAAALNQAIAFNAFLSGWIDIVFYVIGVMFLALGLSNLDL